MHISECDGKAIGKRFSSDDKSAITSPEDAAVPPPFNTNRTPVPSEFGMISRTKV